MDEFSLEKEKVMLTKLKCIRKKLERGTKATLNKIGVDKYVHCSFDKHTKEEKT